jgi:hypothetical protein
MNAIGGPIVLASVANPGKKPTEVFLTLRNPEGRYFRGWSRGKPPTFVKHLCVARVWPVRDRMLAESFREFLGRQGTPVELCETSGGKVVPASEPRYRYKKVEIVKFR